MTQVKLSPKFQVVIPKDAREEVHLHSGQKLSVVVKEGIISLVPDRPLQELRGFLKGMKVQPLREKKERL